LPKYSKDSRNIIIEPYFKKFYEFLENLFNTNMYYFHPVDIITSYFKEFSQENNDIFFKTNDDFLVLLKYYIMGEGRRLDRIIGGDNPTRATLVLKKLSNECDTAKTYRSIQANLTHAMDAYIVRQITLKLGYPIITIHDSLGIDILNLKKFIKVSQEVLQHVYDYDPLVLNKKCNKPLKVTSNMIFL
jgi:hypothetical protein